jgi:hypothetical protein
MAATCVKRYAYTIAALLSQVPDGVTGNFLVCPMATQHFFNVNHALTDFYCSATFDGAKKSMPNFTNTRQLF